MAKTTHVDVHISSGEMVPEVMTTLLNFSKTGAIASAGSRHLQGGKMVGQRRYWGWIHDRNVVGTHVKWKTGLATVAVSVSYGSRMSRKPKQPRTGQMKNILGIERV